MNSHKELKAIMREARQLERRGMDALTDALQLLRAAQARRDDAYALRRTLIGDKWSDRDEEVAS